MSVTFENDLFPRGRRPDSENGRAALLHPLFMLDKVTVSLHTVA